MKGTAGRLLLWSAALGAGTLSAAAHAAEPAYPTKPIRMVVPFAPGGPGDAIGRLIGKKLTENLGQVVVVDNRGGAATIVGTDIAAKSQPDGYTLLLISTTHAVNPSLYAKLPYDPLRDFDPVTLVTSTPFMLVVHPSLPANTVPELISIARAKPGRLNYGSSGNGSSIHLTSELLEIAAKIDMTHIPYKGSGPAFLDLIAGRINLLFSSTVSSLPHVKSGKVRALAITSQKRAQALPDMPTVAEYYPGFESSSWFGLLVPAKTPNAIIERLAVGTRASLEAPDVRQFFVSQGAELGGNTPAEFEKYFRTEIEKWAGVVKAAGVQLEQ